MTTTQFYHNEATRANLNKSKRKVKWQPWSSNKNVGFFLLYFNRPFLFLDGCIFWHFRSQKSRRGNVKMSTPIAFSLSKGDGSFQHHPFPHPEKKIPVHFISNARILRNYLLSENIDVCCLFHFPSSKQGRKQFVPVKD